MRQLLLSSITRCGFLHQGSKWEWGSSVFIVVVRVVVGSGGWALAVVAGVACDEDLRVLALLVGVGYSRCLLLLLAVVAGKGDVYDGTGTVRPRFLTASSRMTFCHLLTRVL